MPAPGPNLVFGLVGVKGHKITFPVVALDAWETWRHPPPGRYGYKTCSRADVSGALDPLGGFQLGLGASVFFASLQALGSGSAGGRREEPQCWRNAVALVRYTLTGPVNMRFSNLTMGSLPQTEIAAANRLGVQVPEGLIPPDDDKREGGADFLDEIKEQLYTHSSPANLDFDEWVAPGLDRATRNNN